MLDHLTADGSKDAFEIFASRLATMACKAAVKGNHSMSPQEADKLIDELLTLKNPYNCPHGRPTIIAMSKTEIEKKIQNVSCKILNINGGNIWKNLLSCLPGLLRGKNKAFHCPCKSSKRRDHFRGLHAGLPPHGYRFRQDHAGRNGWRPTSSGGCTGANRRF